MHADLLAQAIQLATLDPKKPKQANLRRAVSAAYYAVFHFLVQNACRIMIGTQHSQAAFRHVLGRAYTHTNIKQACLSFSGGTLKSNVTKGLPKHFQIPVAIQELAATFLELQNIRHLADYDLTERFKRSDVIFRIERVGIRINSFDALPSTDEKKFFLACLWAWKELNNR